jgi:hypothetical protein
MSVYTPTESEISSFCDAMYAMYEYGKNVKPDVIIFPLRGAHPFYAAYSKIADLKGDCMPDAELPPLGTLFDKHTCIERGLTKPEKVEVFYRCLDTYFGNMPRSRNILLVDEVMIGGTIMAHHHLLEKYAQKKLSGSEIHVCAIEDGKREKSGKYRNAAGRKGFHRIGVQSLFVMDRQQYLPIVRKNDNFSVEIESGKLEEILEAIEKRHR